MVPPPCFLPQHLFLLLLCISTTYSAVEDDELESMLILLRARGHNLFSNAIATSDLVYEIITGTNSSAFTFFAPNDSSLFALDMTATASDYIAALRCHIIPYRLSFNQLRHFSSGYALRTLLQNHHIHIDYRRSNSTTSSDEDAIYIENVRLVAPGLFHSHHIAVHGLEGILSCHRSRKESQPERPIYAPQASFSANHTVFPPDYKVSHNISESPGVSEPADFHEYSPTYSPAYEPWPGIPIASVSVYNQRTEAPAPEFSENDDPTAFPSVRDRDGYWMTGVDTEEEERESVALHSISPADLSAIIESDPFNEMNSDDCNVMPPGYCASS